MRTRHFTTKVYVILIAVICLHACHGSNILFFSLYGSTSHIITFLPAIEALHSRGHNVTYLTFGMPPNKHLNESINVLELKSVQAFAQANKRNPFQLKNEKLIAVANFLSDTTAGVCSALMKDANFKLVVEDKSTKYDAVVIDPSYSECGLSLVWLLGNPPLIYYCSTYLYNWISFALDIPSPYAYVPLYLTRFTDEMSFSERYANTFGNIALILFRNYHLLPMSEMVIRKTYPSLPSLADIEKNTSFVFANSHSASLDFSRPLAPFFAEVGGTHCRPARPLPKDLEDFIRQSGNHGFIYFSLGTYVQGADMDSDKISMFLGVFKRLKQHVIWKFEDELPDLPRNVRLMKWLPQQDLLGHPKIKLFISQGGQLSVQEAIYHNVSVLGLPILQEHISTLTNLQKKGIAEILDNENLNENIIYYTITKMVNNTKYKDNSHFYSLLFRDRPMDAIDTVTFWVEYVIRYNGAHHLRFKTDHLNVFQYFLLDIIGLTLLVITVAIVIFKKGCSYCLRKLWRTKAPMQTKANYHKKSK